jgi:hypothetical protein
MGTLTVQTFGAVHDGRPGSKLRYDDGRLKLETNKTDVGSENQSMHGGLSKAA